MAIQSVSSFLEAGLYIGYMNCFATGECVTSCIAVAGLAKRAEPPDDNAAGTLS